MGNHDTGLNALTLPKTNQEQTGSLANNDEKKGLRTLSHTLGLLGFCLR